MWTLPTYHSKSVKAIVVPTPVLPLFDCVPTIHTKAESDLRAVETGDGGRIYGQGMEGGMRLT